MKVEPELRTPGGPPEAHLAAVYQPVVHLHTGQVVAAEALTRFLASDRSPTQWFEEAAHNGTSVPLQIAAARMALAGLADLPVPVRLTLNFSPEALIDPAVTELLAPHASRLILELTEREPVRDFEQLREALGPLRRAGAQLAADDVGTGFANVGHVSALRPDILKIDQTVVAGVIDEPVSRAFIAAVVGFSADASITVIAEGVHTQDQLHQLRLLGVEHAQGYLLGRPGPPIQVRRLWQAGCDAAP